MSLFGFHGFVDASAGAIGALFGTVCLYPLDIAKIRKQAGTNNKESERTSENSEKDTADNDNNSVIEICHKTFLEEGFTGLYAGLCPKAIHTVLSSFVYFYWYSFFMRLYKRRIGKLGTTANLVIAFLAGAINISMTLPLEVVTTRLQADTESSKKRFLEVLTHSFKESGVTSLWKGYIASLILVSNPAINYTLFDQLKLRLRRIRMRSNRITGRSSLGIIESFLLGALAKAVATILTYPVIRAKVIMQAERGDVAEGTGPTSQRTLSKVLQNIGVNDGVCGLYKGCSAQLTNTMFKSALLFMTKEQIEKQTRNVLYAMRKPAAPTKSA